MQTDYFADVVVDSVRQKEIQKRAMPQKTFVIYFTPRTSSSRLTEILSKTKQLGEANEAFNPNFVPNIAQAVQGFNTSQYIKNLSRWQNRGGVFGFEITGHQLRALFPDTTEFFNRFSKTPCFWLIRKDIVAQAVSLAKMVSTSVSHSVNASQDERDAANDAFLYNPKEIKQWLNHILVAERHCEEWFAKYDMAPMRLSYETITKMESAEIVQMVAAHIGVNIEKMPEFASLHHKIGTQKNRDYAQQFRSDEVGFLQTVAKERAKWLAALDNQESAAESNLMV